MPKHLQNRNNLETAKRTFGSCSQCFNASTDFVFLCGRASKNIASAHSSPEFGHSCSARAINVFAISFKPALISILIEANHKVATFGFFKRPRSNTDLAFVKTPRFSSKSASKSHSANANQSSTLVLQHSTARDNKIFASSGFSNSTAAFHNLTEFGMCSNALRKTRLFALVSVSKSDALIQIRTEVGI
uniref:CSON002290 protein n=1 Tax=Culicoides sonorensis TaxID=179676 RepID=A0A336MJ23_CULSO